LYGYSIYKNGYKLEQYESKVTLSPEECKKNGLVYAINDWNFVEYTINVKETFDLKTFMIKKERDTISKKYYHTKK
jgi:hypothetical protein